MKKVAYFDCPTGIAGNMCIGAILSAGMPLEMLQTQLEPLKLENEYKLIVTHVSRQEQVATSVTVQPGHTHGHRHLPEIETLIQQASFPPQVEQWSLAIFRQLAAAEAAVHGIPANQVHFHEVGATDALVDVVGTCLGLYWLGVERMVCSPLPVGGGTVNAAHGRLPVPAPAVLELLRRAQVPVYSNGIHRELVTPTGAAIATSLCQSFGPPPAMVLKQVGLGAGSHDLPIPNILRLWIGTETPISDTTQHLVHHPGHPHPQRPAQSTEHRGGEHSHREHGHSHSDLSHDSHQHAGPDSSLPNLSLGQQQPGYTESIVELQTQLDDLTPQAIGYLYDRLFQVGALDVFTQAIGMKKNRPGILLTVVCTLATLDLCQSLLFAETTTLGIRHTLQQRRTLHRTWQSVETLYGPVDIKAGLATPTGPVINLQPEYEHCAQLARTQGVSWKQIQWAAIAAAQPLYQAQNWHAQNSQTSESQARG